MVFLSGEVKATISGGLFVYVQLPNATRPMPNIQCQMSNAKCLNDSTVHLTCNPVLWLLFVVVVVVVCIFNFNSPPNAEDDEFLFDNWGSSPARGVNRVYDSDEDE